MAKYINLTRGQRALVDDDVFDTLNAFKWFAQWDPETETYYARRQIRLRKGRGGQTAVSMHRQVMGLVRGERSKVDHINMDTLDNRRQNLRLASDAQNKWNMGKTSINSSGFKGVFRNDGQLPWKAAIRHHGTLIHLGKYHDPKMAALAYDVAALTLHGAFARVNVLTKFAQSA